MCLDDLWGRVDSLDIRARELLLGVPVAGECEGKQVGAPPVGSGRVCWQCVCVRVGRVMLLHRPALLPHAHPPAHPPTHLRMHTTRPCPAADDRLRRTFERPYREGMFVPPHIW